MFDGPTSRRSLLGGLTAGTALALAGCSGSPKAPDNPAAPTGSELIGKPHVDVYAWSNGPTIDANFRRRATLFNEAHQGKFTAKVNFLPYDQFWQKVQLQYAANKPFDMYYWDIQAYAHYRKGLVYNQQPVIDSTELSDAGKYPTALYDPWRFDGQNLFCVPENIQSMALFYNKKHFDEAGLEYPGPTWTWDQVIAAAEKLKKTSGSKVTRWGLDIQGYGVWWAIQTLSWAAGTAFVDKPLEPTAFQLTDPRTIEAMRFIQDLMWKSHIAPTPEEAAAMSQQNAGFLSGAVSMNPGGTWNIAAYQQMKDPWDMTSLPLYQGQNIQPYWLGGWVIPKKSAALSAAQAFATWSATEFQPQMAKDHDWIPIQNAARESEDMLKGMPTGFRDAMKNLPQARIGDIYTENMQRIFNEVFATTIAQLMAKKVTPEEAAQKMQDAATKLL
jgi:multiple sugar transport system substrate-binding protein